MLNSSRARLPFLAMLLLFLPLLSFSRKRLPGFSVSMIPDAVFARMQGKSYPAACPVRRQDLRHLKLLHVDLEGHVRHGEMVCNKAIANDVLEIFEQLYEHRYPIASVRLIDDFGASDEASMRANNSSSFCYRVVRGSKKLSAHAKGMAVDINTLYNPYYKRLKNGKTVTEPATARPYLDRSKKHAYMIQRGDLCYRLFKEKGFRWGGDWKHSKDYQHFEK